MLQNGDDEGQSQSHAGVVSFVKGVVALGREMRLGAAAAHLLGHAAAVVAHFQNDLLLAAKGAQHNPSAPGRGGDERLPSALRVEVRRLPGLVAQMIRASRRWRRGR